MSNNNTVFVVHGRNHRARDAVVVFIRSVGLTPILWNDAVRLTRKAIPSVIETVRAGIDAAQCVVILFTGDDVAQVRTEYGTAPLQRQPRPNVLFEAGWALAVAGQERTIILQFGALRPDLTDIGGLTNLMLTNDSAKRAEFRSRLSHAGCQVNESNTYLNPSTGGDFDAAIVADSPADGPMTRGGYTAAIVDAAFNHSRSLDSLLDEIENYVVTGSFQDISCNYFTAAGASYWLSLSNNPTYGHAELVQVYQRLQRTVSEIVRERLLFDNGCRIDLVSLGPGDGQIDIRLMHSMQERGIEIANYYPIDISIDLLRAAVGTVVSAKTWLKPIQMKAMQGNFLELSLFKPVFDYEKAPNVLMLIGFTFGNYNESWLLSRLSSGMDAGDILVLDARLLPMKIARADVVSDAEAELIITPYRNAQTNRFAFSAVEAVTDCHFSQATFRQAVNRVATVVPGAFNVVTYCTLPPGRFRDSGKKVVGDKDVALASATLYDWDKLGLWLGALDGFSLVKVIRDGDVAVAVLQRR